VQNASQEQKHSDICASFDYQPEANRCITGQGKFRYQAGGWPLSRLYTRVGEPAVLLHPFFPKYFETLAASSDMSEDEKLQRFGAYFHFAVVLVHELAHCFNIFPKVKSYDPDGRIHEAFADAEEAMHLNSLGLQPECGLSWERSMFAGHIIRFTSFEARENPQSFWYSNAEQLLIPQFHDLASHYRAGSWGCRVEGKSYRTTSEYREYERTLIPWQWICDWFQKEHWSDERKADQIKAPPPLTWFMRYEIPDTAHQESCDQEIVRIEIQAPKLRVQTSQAGVTRERTEEEK